MRPVFLLLAALIAGSLAGYGLYLAFFQAAPLAAPPANTTGLPPPTMNQSGEGIRVTFIEASDCGLCNTDGYVMQQAKTILIQRAEVQVESERTLPSSDPEAAALMSQYGIPVAPAVIVEGPVGDYPDLVSHWTQTLGIQSGDALISVPFPPYQVFATGQVVGLLEGVAINPSDCRYCADGGSFIASLQGIPASMVFSETKTYFQDDPEAIELIERLNITEIPTILLSDDVQSYPIYNELGNLGDVNDGWFVLRDVPAPYVDLPANETRGLVKTIYLFDQSCADCFDIRGFASYLSDATGIAIEQETYFDVRSDDGAAIARNYNVSRIPTLLLSPDADYYTGFRE
ncbi:MAG: hypothetical protein ACOY58_06865, partial [Candidatus Micrarchaeota archaeon]